MMKPESLIAELGSRSGLGSLKFSEQGVASIISNEKYTTHFERSTDDSSVTLYGVLGPLPSDNRAPCLMALLSANLFGQETAGASFGLDQYSEELYLYTTVELENLAFDTFYRQLEAFLKAQQFWTEYLKEKGYEKDQQEPPQDLTGGLFLDKA